MNVATPCRTRPWLLVVCCLLPVGSAGAEMEADRPRVLIDGWSLELVAQEPEIVTPVGVVFDQRGRLLVVESHTHFRPEDYEGPARDRIRALEDSDGDGRLDRWSNYFEGTTATMGLAAAPDGRIFAAARNELWQLRDSDGDGVADENQRLAWLDTEGDYPHNGLGSVVFVAPDTLYLGVGENEGFDYTLVGRRGDRLHHGRGQGGTVYVYHLSPESERELERIADGFWNPFALAWAPNGELFALDNDPDASPPCRLIHVIAGGDYGFKYQYGRNGLHPLQAWDGQLPGTLPMVCGTGEAPSAMLPYRGALWVTSWGDHTIERYRLTPRGTSFDATKEVVVQGGTEFRPVGMAIAPDGSIYFSDWVKRNYDLHRHGRIWRLRPTAAAADQLPWPKVEDFAWMDRWPNRISLALEYKKRLHSDPFVRTRWAYRQSTADELPPPTGVAELQARRLAGEPLTRDIAGTALQHDDAAVRLYMVRWIADDHLTEFRDEVASLLERDVPDERYYLAVLAAIDWLDRPPRMTSSDIADGLLARELRRDDRPAERKAMALGLISPDHNVLTGGMMEVFLRSDFGPLRTAAVRTLALQSRPERFELLADVATDEQEDPRLRADAVAGLAAAADEHRELLERLAADPAPVVQREAARALRPIDPRRAVSEEKPPVSDLDAWLERLATPGDADAGRRLFFSDQGAKCSVCHAHGGRGGIVGPELTTLGQYRSRRQLVQSILQPSAEIAPHFVPWILETSAGKTFVGLRAAQGGDTGWETYFDADGESITFASEQIESRTPSETSIMPAGLEQLITVEELRDLVTFLMGPSASEAER